MFEKESIEKMKRCSGWAISSREAIVALVGECGFILTTISIPSSNETACFPSLSDTALRSLNHRFRIAAMKTCFFKTTYRDDSVLCFERGNLTLLIQISPV